MASQWGVKGLKGRVESGQSMIILWKNVFILTIFEEN